MATVATNVVEGLPRPSSVFIHTGRAERHMDHGLSIAQDLLAGFVGRDGNLAVGIFASLTTGRHNVEATNGIVGVNVGILKHTRPASIIGHEGTGSDGPSMLWIMMIPVHGIGVSILLIGRFAVGLRIFDALPGPFGIAVVGPGVAIATPTDFLPNGPTNLVDVVLGNAIGGVWVHSEADGIAMSSGIDLLAFHVGTRCLPVHAADVAVGIVGVGIIGRYLTLIG
mmetsp:Transcript_20410/g.44611  ORF Transcript_20410/g.44611 Transcript_20410/m.44611 type:complete len:225 (+) Transcript_20410:4715-5389(+)